MIYIKVYKKGMEQQLLENIIEIVPDTMEDLLAKVQSILSSSAIQKDEVLSNIIKSLFYGLWNFDKMINQHKLNTKISELMVKLPKKNGLIFFRALIEHLHEKWNYIDHHRINKFMQLVRYLILQAFKMCEKHKINKKKVDDILLEKVYNKVEERSGMVYHITDIYFELCEQAFPLGATLENLKLMEQVITSHPNENLRLYIGEHVYEKYKEKICRNYAEESDLTKLDESLQQFSRYFLELAKKQEKESHRKNLYTMVGFAKSPQPSFGTYMTDKKIKQEREKEKKQKKLSKFKKQEIKKLKAKRKEKTKEKGINKKMTSVRKFADKNRMKKGIEIE